MNILEEQVSDLDYLAESPVQLPGDMNSHGHTAESPADGSGNDPDMTKKRKADENTGSTHTRAKRNRYVSIAWYGTALHPVPASPCRSIQS